MTADACWKLFCKTGNILFYLMGRELIKEEKENREDKKTA